MEGRPTVFVIDDDADLRNSLASTIRAQGFRVEAFSDADRFLDSCQPDTPGCLVMVLSLRETNGLALQRKLAEKGCRQPFIIISGHGDVSLAVKAMQQGAVDFLEKPPSRQRLFACIRHSIRQDQRNRERRTRRAAIQARIDTLTPREHEVLRYVAMGRLTKQIARELDISPKTVEVHRSRIMSKMQAESVAQLVRLVIGLEAVTKTMSKTVPSLREM